MSNYETASYVSKLFGKEDVQYTSKSISKSSSSSTGTHSDSSSDSESESKSYSYQERDALKSRKVLEFEQGQFASIVPETDNNIAQLKVRYYHRFNIAKEDLILIEAKEQKSVDNTFFKKIISEINNKVFTEEGSNLNDQINVVGKERRL